MPAPITNLPINNVGNPNLAPVGPAPQPAPAKPAAGFDPAGQPLGDAEVWNLFVGRGESRRAVNTAAAEGKKAIDAHEQRKLLELLKADPKQFLQRLLADSANGSAVEVGFTKELKGVGIARVDFVAKDGHVDTKASLEVFHKAADGYLKAYLAKDAAKGPRPKVTLEISGDLNREGGIDGVKLEVRAENVPAFSTEKLLEIEKVKGELKAVLGGKGRAREKQAAVLTLVEEAVKRASDLPVGFLVSLVSDHHELEIDLKEKTRATRVHAETGNGRYALTFADILDGENRGNEVDLGAKVEGSVSEDKSAVKIDAAKIYTADAIALSWGEDGRPVAHKIDADTGEKKPVDDHLAELMQYLPMALALAGRRDL